jgi:hypothetical protein
VSFADATALHPSGPGRFTATVPRGWDIAGATNGGYLMALVARAVLVATQRDDPLTVTAHYLGRVVPGPVTIEVTTHDARRSRATASVSLRAEDGAALLVALVTAGSLPAPGSEQPVLLDGHAPQLPAFDRCVRAEPAGLFPPPFMGQVDVRLHPDDVPFVAGHTRDEALVRGWFSLRDGEPSSTLAVLLAADAMPPAIFTTSLPVAWTPTLELTVQVRGRPSPGPMACVVRTRFVTAGYLEADGEVWDCDGRIVGLSRQLALVPRGS